MSHNQESQIERAKRLRALIEDLKAGKHPEDPATHEPSLRERIEQLEKEAGKEEQGPKE